MAYINAADFQAHIIKEVSFGVTPTSGTGRMALPLKTGYSLPTFTHNEIDFDIQMPKRASGGTRRGSASGSGTFDLNFASAGVIDLLIESAIGGAFSTGVAKAGDTDVSFSTVSTLSPTMYYIDKGCMVNKFSLSAKAADAVTCSFDFLNTDRAEASTNSVVTAVAFPSASYPFDGSEVSSISVGGATLAYTELNLEVSHDRSPRNVLGSPTPVGIGTQGKRTITLEIKAYRESFAINSLVTGQPQPVSFNIGDTGYGKTFTLPAAIGMNPTDETSGDLFVSMKFTASYDATAGSDLVIANL